MTSPYADTAELYLAAGWHPFPLPYGKKIPPPTGFTGYTAVPVTAKHVDAWIAKAGGDPQNIGLHLPEHVIGLDVDHYGDKTGGYTLDAHVTQLGPLPATWKSSSRGGFSGIRFYQVPAGRMWAGELAPQGSVDIISHHERFAVVHPSIHPSTGHPYGWTDPDGFPTTEIPTVDLLPLLPDAWVAHLSKGDLADRDLKDDLTRSDAWAWLADNTPAGMPCRALTKVLHRAGLALEFGDDHHGAIRGPVMSVVRMGEQGHAGALAALQELRDVFESSLDGHRSWDEQEWARLVVGAVATVTVQDQRTPFEDRGCCAEQDEETADLDDVLDDETTFTREKGSTWGRIDLTEIISDIVSGVYQAPAPTVGRFGDKALFYRDAVNSVAGPPSSGKTWVVLVAAQQEMEAGNDVVYIDMENGLGPFISRLINDMGIDPAVIKDHLTYIYPEEKLGSESGAFLKEALRGVRPTLIAIDTTGVSLALEGASPNDDDAVALWFSKIPSKFARRTGAAVVLIDHVTHSTETRDRPIGSQRKLAAVDTQFMLHHGHRFSRGMDGVADITCPKDRHGRHEPGRAICRLSMRHVDDALEATLVDVAMADGDDATLGLSAKAREVLDKVRDHYYENHGQEDPEGNVMDARPNITEIRGMVTGNNTAIKLAVEELVRHNLLLKEAYAGTTRGRTPMVYSPLVDEDFVREEGTE